MGTSKGRQRLTTQEVADRLGLSTRGVLRLIASGQLAAIDVSTRPGSRRATYRVLPADVDDFERRRKVGKPEPKRSARRVKLKGIRQFV